MCKSNYAEKFKYLCENAFPLQDEEIDSMLHSAQSLLNEEHIPTILCICTSPNRQLYQFPSALGLKFECPENQEITDWIWHNAESLVIEYGENNHLYVQQNGLRVPAQVVLSHESKEHQHKYPMIMTLQDEYLMHHHLILSSNLSAVQPEFIGSEIDLVCLKTNATMAMTQEERTWIETVLLPWHGSERFQVWIDMLERLNSEEDVSNVIECVQKTLERNGLPVQNVVSSSQLADWINRQFADPVQLEELRDRQIVKNCFFQVQRYVENELETIQVDVDLVQRAKSQLEYGHQSLELAGQITSKTVLRNEYENLKFQLLNDLERYCKEAGENCIREIRDSGDIQQTAEAVQRYLDNAWRHYQLEANRIIQKETEKISERLMKKMETDAGELFSQMDQDVQTLLARAMKLNTTFHTVSRIKWNESQQNLKREARNIMLLSVPLLLVNPTWSIATLIGAQIYKKHKGNALNAQLNTQLKDDVLQQCKQAQDTISDTLASGLDEAARQSAEYVQEAYSNLTCTLQKQLDDLVQVCNAAHNKVEKLSALQKALQETE